jgi:hypothetical protein
LFSKHYDERSSFPGSSMALRPLLRLLPCGRGHLAALLLNCWRARGQVGLVSGLLATLAVLAASPALGQPASLVGIANGVAAALSGADDAAGIAVLQGLRDKLESKDQFWNRTVEDVLGSAQNVGGSSGQW